MTPFIKWVGNKQPLLKEISKYYPFEKGFTKYVEPFTGGGAVFLDIIDRFNLEEVTINDLSPDLVNLYTVVQTRTSEFTTAVDNIKELHAKAKDKKEFYYSIRGRLNELQSKNELSVERAALTFACIWLSFNGLWRVNSKGIFNAAFGGDRRKIGKDGYDYQKLSTLLKKVNISHGSYVDCSKFIDSKTFVYLDPPYRSDFRNYSASPFNDAEQIKLSEFVKEIDIRGAKFVLSNSDSEDGF